MLDTAKVKKILQERGIDLQTLDELIVVYDMDDTLWNLNEKACEMAGIDYDKIQHYSLSDNTLLTSEEKHKLKDLYSSVDLWKGMKWVRGARKIHEIESLSLETRNNKAVIKVLINSHCNNQDVADFKRTFVGKDLKLPEEQVVLNVANNHKTKKELPPNTLIFVDDSPFNLQSSTALFTIISDKPWNKEIEESDTIIRCSGMNEIRKTVEEIVTCILQLI